jgi:hypothetical protein
LKKQGDSRINPRPETGRSGMVLRSRHVPVRGHIPPPAAPKNAKTYKVSMATFQMAALDS